MTDRRDFLKTMAIGGASAIAGSTILSHSRKHNPQLMQPGREFQHKGWQRKPTDCPERQRPQDHRHIPRRNIA